MKKALILICNFYFLSLIFNLSPSFADVYEWVDDNGVVNFSDDISRIPPAYKNRLKVHKQKPIATAPSSQKKTVVPSEPKKDEPAPTESLEWWKTEFQKKKQEISQLEKAILEQKKYISLFNKGRRVGQIYSKEEIDTYNEYTKQIPIHENKLEELNRELEGLKKKALQRGVPRSVRE